MIGDSVATGMYWHDDAIAVMQKELGVYWDVAVCRTIDGTSCPFDGERAPTLLQVVAARGIVPPTVVVEVGYNDPAGRSRRRSTARCRRSSPPAPSTSCGSRCASPGLRTRR